MDLGSIPATNCHTNTEGVGNDGMFTYSADLQALLWTESKLVRSLHNYILQEEAKLKN